MTPKPSNRRRGPRFVAALTLGLWVVAGALSQAACTAPHDQRFIDSGSAWGAQVVEGRFRNPAGSPTVANTWRDHLALWWWAAWGASKEELQPTPPPGHVLSTDQAIALLAAQGTSDSLTWLGHAAFLIRVDGKTILVDPFLGEYASPIPGVGPRRHAGPAIGVDRLPPIDVLLISHNHYDHLDLHTLERLAGKDTVQVVVPAGVGGALREVGYRRVTELSWGESVDLMGLKVSCVPAVHFSSRGVFDHDRSLWAGYVIGSSHGRLYFAGDTAYHPELFKALRREIGPVDVALVPIGAYEPGNLMADVHVDPEQAVRLARDLGARTVVGMHWGTIALSTEPAFEPPIRFRAAAGQQGFGEDATWVMAIGESRSLGVPFTVPTPPR